jgi:hypothetical protein
MEPPKSRKCA